jgi:HK97 gp10 family phage protein
MAKFSRREYLLKKMAAMPPAVRSAVKQALAQGADDVTDAMKRLVPVDSGKLQGSIRQTWGGRKVAYASLSGAASASGDPELTVTISAGDSGVRYAHLVEFGTAPHINGGRFAGSRHPGAAAKPFFYPAYRANKRRVKARISRATTKAVKALAAS